MRYFPSIFLCAFLHSILLIGGTPKLYVANDNSVSVIDTINNKVIATIDFGSPQRLEIGDIAISASGRYVYVASDYGTPPTFMNVIETSTNTIISQTPLPSEINDFDGYTLSPDGRYIYVLNGDNISGSLFVLETIGYNIVKTIPIPMSPKNIVTSRDGLQIYVCGSSQTSSVLTVIDAKNNTITQNVPFAPDGFNNIAITPNGNYLYVTYQDGSSRSDVFVIDTKNNTVVKQIPFPVGSYPSSITITPNGLYAYITTDNPDGLSIIDITTNTLLPSYVDTGYYTFSNIPITPDGVHAYTANTGQNNVTVINLKTNTVVGTIPVGLNPESLAITPLLPPTRFKSKQTLNNFGVASESFNTLTWKPSRSTITGYRLMRNGVFLANLPKTATSYKDHNRPRHQIDVYTLTAFNSAGSTSFTPITTVKGN